jgi:hypothetical protein
MLRFQYQQTTEPVLARSDPAQTESEWHFPWSEPVRQKIAPALAIALAASGAFAPIPQALDPSNDEASWHYAWSEPIVKTKLGLAAADQQALIQAPNNPLVSFAYFNNLSDPVRVSLRLLPGDNQYEFSQPFPFINISWFDWLSEPVRIKPGLRPELQQAFAYGDQKPVVTFSYFDWLSEPVRQKPGVPAAEQQFLAYGSYKPLVSFAYYNWLTEPVRLKPGLPAPEQQFFATDPSVIPLQELIEWFANLSEPVRLKIGLGSWLQQFYTGPSQLRPTATTFAALSAIETKDTLVESVRFWNTVVSGEIGVIEESFTGGEIGVVEQVATAGTSGAIEQASTVVGGSAVAVITSAHVSIQIL